MPLDPERPIEKLLRDCAKERRDHAPDWKLHPANRRLLQQEVNRKFGHASSVARAGWFEWVAGLPWTKVLGGLATLMIVSGIVWFTLPSRARKESEMLLARNELASKSKIAATDLSSPPSADKLALNEPQQLNQGVSAQEALAVSKSVAAKEETLESRRDSPAKDPQLSSDLSIADSKQHSVPPALLSDRESVSPRTPAAASSPPPAAEQAVDAFRARYGLAPAASAPMAASPASAPAGLVAENQKKQVTPTLQQSTPAEHGPAQVASSARFGGSGGNRLINGPSNQVVQLGYFAGTQIATTSARSFLLNQNTAAADSLKTEPQSNPRLGQILTFFRVEQAGSELRVIDSDESVYAGLVQTGMAVPAVAVSATAAEPSKRGEISRAVAVQTRTAKAADPTARAQPIASPSYTFQVVGTNRTSNQRVIFSGTLTGLTNAADGLGSQSLDTALGSAVTSSLGRLQPSGFQALASQQTLHVSGTALIGPAQRLEIEAVPAPPQR